MIFSAVTRTVTLRFTCENCANSLSASMGMCPSSSWQQSLSDEQSQSRTRPRNKSDKRPKKKDVHDSRLWGVHGSGGVADVLRALEHPEGQAAEEVSGRQQAGNWAQLETSSLCRETHTQIYTL